VDGMTVHDLPQEVGFEKGTFTGRELLWCRGGLYIRL
jgi:hypothetical protein